MDPGTVVAFLTDCPCAPATRRRRVAAIDHHHAAAGLPRPGESAAVRTQLGRPTCGKREPSPDTVTAVETALRALPSRGWTQGMFGRRDRCLLVLSQLASVPYQHLATLTVRDITINDGAANVTTPTGAWMVAPDDDPVLCGSCAIVRWLRVLDIVMTKPGHRHLARVVGKAQQVTDRSPQLCRSTRGLSPDTLDAPLLPPIEQRGYVPFPVQRLTPHSLSRRVRDLLSGDLGAHRHLPVDHDEDAEPVTPTPVPVVGRAVCSRDDAQWAWARRRADLDNLAGIDELLNDIDDRAQELDRRTTALLIRTDQPQ